MTSDLYREALEQAERELANVDAAAEELELKRAKLRQTTAVLRSQLGIAVAPEASLTDSILTILKAWNGFATVPQVLERLIIMGYQVQSTTVASILSRLVKTGQVLGGRGISPGYAWKEPLSSSEVLSAQSAVMKKSRPAR